MAKDKPSKADAEEAAVKLTAKAVKAARSGDADRTSELAEKAKLALDLLRGQEDES